jgi:integrase
MTKTDVAKLPGLFQRAGVYQLRVVVPLDLKAVYGNKSKLVQSLETSDRKEASLLATQERAKLLEEFKEKRRLLAPQKLDSVTIEMASELAQRVRARVLKVDDVLRDNPTARATLFVLLRSAAPDPLEALTIRSRLPAPDSVPKSLLESLDGLSAGDAAALAGLNEVMSDAAGVKLAQRRLSSVLPLVKEEAHQLGLAFDPHAPGAREALQEALKAYRQAWHEVMLRDAGEIIDTPTVQLLKRAAAKPVKLRDVYTRWKESKPRSADSHNAMLRALAAYEEFTLNPPLPQLTRAQGDGFRTWLQHPDRKTSSKTARDKFTWVKSLLKYAAEDLELIPKNPWTGLDIVFQTQTPRRPWTSAELVKFFNQPLHRNHDLPKGKQAGGAAAYWIPLIGLYTGARIGELAQLRVMDVEDVHGKVPLFSLTDEGEGQSLKTKAGRRKVPIHSELIRLGFLDYVDALQKRGELNLWPSLTSRKAKPGDYFGRWFSEYRKKLGFGEYPDFHCLRHTVRSALAEAEVPEDTIDALVGHEAKGTGRRVYTHRAVATLQKAIEILHYPALSLPTAASAA